MHGLDPETVFDPRITDTLDDSEKTVHTGGGVVRVGLHVLDLQKIDGAASLSDAEKAVAKLVTGDGGARAVLNPGDGYYTGTVHALDGSAYTDADGSLRYLGVGDGGFAQTNLNLSPDTVSGNAPLTVQPASVGTLDLQDNQVDPDLVVSSRRFASSGFPWAPSLSPNSPVDITYQANVSELKSVLAPDGMLRFGDAS